MRIAIINQQRKVAVNQKKIRDVIKLILYKEHSSAGDISVTVTTDNKIRKFNRAYLNKDLPTDVLSFSFLGKKPEKIIPVSILGDIIVSADTAVSNAVIYKTTPKEELYLYVIHGLLHLLGYNDITPGKRAVMKKKELHYLRRIKF
ncbi:MAG: rRNA maturation RNase YbeY [Candidatus Omnitrophota bacterium]|nr:rRNA maturation RNase YbeY [Candidatus Omnitrophota bacterium]